MKRISKKIRFKIPQKTLFFLISLTILSGILSGCKPYQKLTCSGSLPAHAQYNSGSSIYKKALTGQPDSAVTHEGSLGSCSFQCNADHNYNSSLNTCEVVQCSLTNAIGRGLDSSLNVESVSGDLIVGCAINRCNSGYSIQGGSCVSYKEKFRGSLSELNASPITKKIVWVGDSITEQGKTGVGNGIGYSTLIQNQYPNIIAINEGVGGDTTREIINRLETITNHGQVDMYILAVGINDIRYTNRTAPSPTTGATNKADYLSNISTIVNTIKASNNNAQIAIISIWPSFWQDQYSSLFRAPTDARMEDYNSGLLTYCDSNNFLYLNAYSNIRNYVNFSNISAISTDGVHPIPNESLNAGKHLYADSVLYDVLPVTDYAPVYTPIASPGHYYKVVISDNFASSDKWVGIRAIEGSSLIQEVFAKTAYPQGILGPTGNDITSLPGILNSFDMNYRGFYNKQQDFPMVFTLSSVEPLTSIFFSGTVKGTTNINRGVGNFELYHSTDPNSLPQPNHVSWTKISEEKAIAQTANGPILSLNLLPAQRKGVFYMLRLYSPVPSTADVLVQKIGTTTPPIKIWQQLVRSSSVQNWRKLFGEGFDNADTSSGLLGQANGGLLISWEAEDHLSTIDLKSFSSLPIGGYRLFRSTTPNSINQYPTSNGQYGWTQILPATFGSQVIINGGNAIITIPAP